MSNNPILGTGGIHHVAVRTHDMAQSLAFYTEALGMSVAADFDFEGVRFVHLDTGDGSLLELVEDDQAITPADDRNVHWHLCFGTDRIESAMVAVAAAGMQVTMPVTPLELNDTSGDAPRTLRIKVAFFIGPSGEVVELLQE
ncbi:MAG: VOC family protein [Phycisphaerales bacterium JB063]